MSGAFAFPIPRGNHDARLYRCHLRSSAFGTSSLGTSSNRLGGSLSGDQAQIGQDYLNGVKLAVDAWNARGGVLGQQIIIAAEDDANR
jgi:branched-chain amino acid transport system substrate-binding protein